MSCQALQTSFLGSPRLPTRVTNKTNNLPNKIPNKIPNNLPNKIPNILPNKANKLGNMLANNKVEKGFKVKMLGEKEEEEEGRVSRLMSRIG